MEQSPRSRRTAWTSRLVPLFVIVGLAAFFAGTRLLTTPLTPPIHSVTVRQIAGIATDANWMERAAREQEEQPEKALDLIPITRGMIVADVGAGSGYMTIRLAH